ncbi:Uncharacterised protein [Oligella urethralis]|nr:Uncharacterised protein [Oligella urethralis]
MVQEKVADNILPDKIKDIINEFEQCINLIDPELQM